MVPPLGAGNSVTEDVAHFLLLGLEVEQIVGGGGHLNGDPFLNRHAEVRQLVDLVRVVGEQAEGFGPQVPENLGPDVILPQVPGKAQAC